MTILLTAGTTQQRASIEQVLSERAHEVLVRDSVDEAEGCIGQYSPDLIVLSAICEKTLDFCRAIRSDPGLALAIVFVGTMDDRDQVPAVVEAGADDFALIGDSSELVPRCMLWERSYGGSHSRGSSDNAGPEEVAAAAGENADRDPGVRIDDMRIPSVRASLERRLEQQRQLAELGVTALKESDELALMGRITEYARRMLDTDASMVFEPVEDQSAFALRAGVGWERGLIGHARIQDAEHEQVSYTLRSRSPIVVGDFESESRFERSALLERYDMVSALTVPIEGRCQPYGVLGVYSRTARHFREYDIHLLQLMANMLGARLEQQRAERQLRNSEMRAKAVLDTTVDAIITIDERGRVESFNEAAEEIFGYAAEEVIGENVKMLMPSPYREEHDNYLQSYRDTGEPKIIGIGREMVGRRKDGTTFPLQLSVSEVKLEDERLFTGIIRDLTEKKRLEKEILHVSEQERRRIGQDLHDGLGQMLNAIAFFSETLTEQLDERDEELAERAEFITQKIREADDQARSLGRGLVMVNTDKDGLYGALHRLCANAEELYGVHCWLRRDGQPEIGDPTVGTHLYRIAQEAINNAVRHGEASEIIVTLASGSEYVRLRVKDDGLGFPEKPEEDNRGMGVRTMHYRAHLIGGSLHIQSDPSGGTTVTCSIPLDEHRRVVAEESV